MLSILLKSQQLEILKFLYRFRFLSRPQIQNLLNHKNHSRILQWLNALTKEEYINRYYEKRITSNPAVYSIAPKGRKYLRKHRDETKVQDDVLRAVWREGNLSEAFRSKRVMVAEVYLALRDQFQQSGGGLKFLTKAELRPFSSLIDPLPDGYFITQDGPRKKLRPHFLDVFGDIPPRIMRRRVNQYIEYYDMEEWQANVKLPFPKVVLVCPNARIRAHLMRYIKTKMERSYADELHFYLTTEELVRDRGLIDEILLKAC